MKKICTTIITLYFLFQTCSNSTGHDSYPEFLFEISYENYAWGYQLSGRYIDSDGIVFFYDYSNNEYNYWTPEDRDNPTRIELIEKYSKQNEKLRQISTHDVDYYYQLFSLLPNAKYTDTVHTGCDMGIIQFIAYYYSEENDTYTKRVLKQYGDLSFQDTLYFLQKITSWLDSTLANVN